MEWYYIVSYSIIVYCGLSNLGKCCHCLKRESFVRAVKVTVHEQRQEAASQSSSDGPETSQCQPINRHPPFHPSHSRSADAPHLSLNASVVARAGDSDHGVSGRSIHDDLCLPPWICQRGQRDQRTRRSTQKTRDPVTPVSTKKVRASEVRR
jgi:hypothetical protein